MHGDDIKNWFIYSENNTINLIATLSLLEVGVLLV